MNGFITGTLINYKNYHIILIKRTIWRFEKINLLNDFYNILEDKVKEINDIHDVDLKSNLDNGEGYYESLFYNYLNFKERALYNKSFPVVFSDEILEKIYKNEIPDEYVGFLDEVICRMVNGENLVPYQSRTINKIDDTLFKKFNIGHLHLVESSNERYYGGSKYRLLYIVFKGRIYLVDVLDFFPEKDEWVKKEYFEIAVRNWPFIYENPRIKSELNVHKEYNQSSEYGASRYVNTNVEVDGNLYIPSNITMTNGVHLNYVKMRDALLLKIRNLENLLNEHYENNCDFCLKQKDDAIWVYEKNHDEPLCWVWNL